MASQAILLIAWYVTWQAVVAWRQCGSDHKGTIAWQTGVAALLTASVFLLHFRVAAFYLPLLAIAFVWEVCHAWRAHQSKVVLLGTLIVGSCALIAVSPALWEALKVYVMARTQSTASLDPAQYQLHQQMYYGITWEAALGILGDRWLVGFAIVCAVIGLLKRNKLTITLLLWVAVLVGIGEAYLLNLPILELSNLSGILIMFYLPIGLVIGLAVAGTDRTLRRTPPSRCDERSCRRHSGSGFHRQLCSGDKHRAISLFRDAG